jgi:hypothetical protein
MKRLYESKVAKGFVEVYESEGTLFVVSGFRREALGVNVELPAVEYADLTEALLRGLDEATRASVIESVIGKNNDLSRYIEGNEEAQTPATRVNATAA